MVKNYFVNNNNIIRATSLDVLTLQEKLPQGVYSVDEDKMGLYLKYLKPRFELPRKIYGDSTVLADRIINTYQNKSNQTGIFLTGDKGSGKTLLLTILANKGIDLGLPVVMVNSAFSGDNFNYLISSIGECILIFDEFEKIYDIDNNAQDGLLTLFDGTFNHKRLTIITSNNEHRISDYLLDRPGRFHYKINYDRLSADVVSEYCQEKEIPEEFTNKLLNYRRHASSFSFDTMQAIIFEYLLYKQSFEDTIKYLNVPAVRDIIKYNVISARKISSNEKIDKAFVTNIQNEAFCLNYKIEEYTEDFWVYHTKAIPVVDTNKFIYRYNDVELVYSVETTSLDNPLLPF